MCTSVQFKVTNAVRQIPLGKQCTIFHLYECKILQKIIIHTDKACTGCMHSQVAASFRDSYLDKFQTFATEQEAELVLTNTISW